jgi:hypothetical protein
VTGAKALVYLADASALSTAWQPLTNGEYQSAYSAGNTVSAGGVALIGPFTFHSPKTGFGDGHKCLVAAVIADGEPAEANYFDAPNSNQVAQRNVQFENCAFPLTNSTSYEGNVEIVLSVVPAETYPSLNGTGPNISVAFDDGDSTWYELWKAQPENNKAYALSNDGSKTTVRLGKSGVTLAAAPLHDGESRTAKASISGLPSKAPATTLGLQATLRDSSTGEALAPSNGGSCKVSNGVVVP